jgi:thiamine-monophosphate kinase
MSELFENTERTELSNLGEFGLIEHLTKNVKIHNSSTIRGIGDDAAVIFHGENKTLVSTDLLIEGVHFDLMYTPLRHLGYKAIMVNLSDICAMNAVPTQVTVSIGLSNRFSLEAIEELYSGILLACDKYKVDLIGGDTSSSQKGLIISVTAIGEAKEENIVYRNGAKKGDLVCVTGDLGGAYMGLQILEREKDVFLATSGVQPDLVGMDYILERQLKPEARLDIVELLDIINVKPTSMIDVSDGLASEVLHICKQSNVGCKIYEDKLPIDPLTYQTARDFNLDPTLCALSGGEDYELLFTVPQSDFDKVKGNSNISIIGYITDESEGTSLITKSNNQHPLKAQGWNAFKKSE